MDVERLHNAMLWTLGRLHELVDAGLCKDNSGVRLMPRGIADYDQLAATGFKPNDYEVRYALAEINRVNPCDVFDELINLVLNYQPKVTEDLQ